MRSDGVEVISASFSALEIRRFCSLPPLHDARQRTE